MPTRNERNDRPPSKPNLRRQRERYANHIRTVVAGRIAELGMSQSDLAKRADCTQGCISAFLGGLREIRTDKLARIMAALGLEMRPRWPVDEPVAP